MKSSVDLMYRVQKILSDLGVEGKMLDDTSRQILLQVASNQYSGQVTTVSDITRHTEYGTAPTVYTRLKRLVELGLIKSESNPADGRSNLLKITKSSEKLIKAGAKAIQRAASS